MVWSGSKNGYYTYTCLKEIELYVQNMITIIALSLSRVGVGGGLHNHTNGM